MGFVKTININFTDNLSTFPITKSLWSYLKLLLICLLELGFGFDQSLPRGQENLRTIAHSIAAPTGVWRTPYHIHVYPISLAWSVSFAMTFNLDLYLQGHSGMTLQWASHQICKIAGRMCRECREHFPCLQRKLWVNDPSTCVTAICQEAHKTAKIWPILCPFYSTYSSGWILSIFCTNDH